jgi:hypothetical protein
MPGCCLPSPTAATALHFTAGYLKRLGQQKPKPCFAFLGGNSPLPPGSTGAISLPCSQRPPEELGVSIFDDTLKSQDDTID